MGTAFLSTARREAATLWSLVRPRRNSSSLAERLDSFYSGQASHYDHFRERLLHGRSEMVRAALSQMPDQFTWLDIGGGTGRLLDFAPEYLSKAKEITILDPCRPLLEVARARVEPHAHIRCVLGEVTDYTPTTPIDLITFSYSLSMMPRWWRALQLADSWLSPHGHVGVVDFYVSPKTPAEGQVAHSWATRTFWPIWFGFNNVFLRPDLLPYLQDTFCTLRLEESSGSVPYLPWVKVPYFVLIGKKTPRTGFKNGLLPILESLQAQS